MSDRDGESCQTGVHDRLDGEDQDVEVSCVAAWLLKCRLASTLKARHKGRRWLVGIGGEKGLQRREIDTETLRGR